MSWKPALPFNVPMTVMATTTTRVNGVLVKSRAAGRSFFGSARSFGGTEVERDGQVVLEDTLRIETWYAPDIVAGVSIRLDEDSSEWEVMGTPEDIGMRHQYLSLKVKRLRGGA